ncbi:hypothetical protein E2C01_071650 [Portunus trituberculatus]|uniref:Uncharacterized protein n=1 Tax=Portunus trituberculatus TaxID=210409 RepID=A0A5B7I0G2_PORTR|nr:hypothetical protein [Portunus trituberculatus]
MCLSTSDRLDGGRSFSEQRDGEGDEGPCVRDHPASAAYRTLALRHPLEMEERLAKGGRVEDELVEGDLCSIGWRLRALKGEFLW